MTRPRMPLTALALSMGCVALAACSTLSDLDGIDIAASGPAPQLVPVEGLLAQAEGAPRASEAVADALAGRAARLKARAALMRGPILDPATRERLARAIRAGEA